jgi:hypothetical protein
MFLTTCGVQPVRRCGQVEEFRPELESCLQCGVVRVDACDVVSMNVLFSTMERVVGAWIVFKQDAAIQQVVLETVSERLDRGHKAKASD